jgi:hypothetical protein
MHAEGPGKEKPSGSICQMAQPEGFLYEEIGDPVVRTVVAG